MTGKKAIESTQGDLAVPAEERRRSTRTAKRIPATLALRDGRALPCSVKEVGIAGLRLLVQEPLEPESGAHLRILAGKPRRMSAMEKMEVLTVPGLVVWCRRRAKSGTWECGFSFHHLEEDVRERLVAFLVREHRIELVEPVEKRRSIRFSAPLVITVRCPGFAGQAVMQDISDSGLRIIARSRLPENAPVAVSFSLDPDVEITVAGCAARCRKMLNTEAWDIGITFPDLGEAARASIIKGISYLIRKRSDELEALLKGKRPWEREQR